MSDWAKRLAMSSARNALGAQTALENLEYLLSAPLHDTRWLEMMRSLFEVASAGDWSCGTQDKYDAEEMAIVTGAVLPDGENRPILAKCGPFRDATSCFDAITIAACVNFVRHLVAMEY